MEKTVKKWARKALEEAPKGSLHHMLGFPAGHKLNLVFLQAIVDTPIGGTAYNHTKTGHPEVKVTYAMKKEAIATLNIQRAERKHLGIGQRHKTHK